MLSGKSANNVDRIVGGWNVIAIAKRDAGDWLDKALEKKVDVAKIVGDIQARDVSGLGCDHNIKGIGEYHNSLAQQCELSEQKKVMGLMTN